MGFWLGRIGLARREIEKSPFLTLQSVTLWLTDFYRIGSSLSGSFAKNIFADRTFVAMGSCNQTAITVDQIKVEK